jgi:hypothetical protein
MTQDRTGGALGRKNRARSKRGKCPRGKTGWWPSIPPDRQHQAASCRKTAILASFDVYAPPLGITQARQDWGASRQSCAFTPRALVSCRASCPRLAGFEGKTPMLDSVSEMAPAADLDLSYSHPSQPRFRRSLIRMVERLSGQPSCGRFTPDGLLRLHPGMSPCSKPRCGF